MEAADRCGDLAGPWSSGCELEAEPPDRCRRCVRSQRIAGAATVFGSQRWSGPCREYPAPGDQIAGQGDDPAPALVLDQADLAVQRQVPQPGVLRVTDPPFAPPPPSLP